MIILKGDLKNMNKLTEKQAIGYLERFTEIALKYGYDFKINEQMLDNLICTITKILSLYEKEKEKNKKLKLKIKELEGKNNE